MEHLLSINDLSKKEILKLIKLGQKIKKKPWKYSVKLPGKTLLMLFAKPSLRTNLSFNVGMHQLGGHAIFYDLGFSKWGKKESIKDSSRVLSRYVDIIMARLYEHKNMLELANYSEVPVINGLDDDEHPCQILGDFLTIKEKFRGWRRVKICYVGDGNNNVTHSLIFGCDKLRMDLVVSCPDKREFLPDKKVIGKTPYIYEKDSRKAVKGCDVVYTDSWMSYQIPASEKKRRVRVLKPFQVNRKLFNLNNDSVFMHCLPAGRGYEVTDEVIDSDRSIVYDQAENRLHIQKAILLKLLKK